MGNLGKRFHRLVDLVFGMRCGHLGADPRPAVGHDRIGETDHVNPLLKEHVGHASGQCGVKGHDRDDRMFAIKNLDAGARKPLPKNAGIVVEAPAQ